MYNHAASFAASRRVGDTAVYNPNRLRERPIPILGPQNITNANENFADDDENASENDTSNVIENPMSEFIGITVTNENEVQDTHISASNQIEDPLFEAVDTSGLASGANQAEPNVTISLAACSISNVNQSGTQNTTATTPVLLLPIVKKEAATIVRPSAANINALEMLINEPEYTVYKDNSMEIIVDTKKGFGKPIIVSYNRRHNRRRVSKA